MPGTPTRITQLWLVVTAFSAWFALFAQFYLMLINRTVSVVETTARYLTFFTILSNLLVAICCTCVLFNTKALSLGFFAKASTQTAVTVYIVIVGIVYNLVLRQIWSPQGLQRAVDELLHLVIPLLFLFYWILLVPKHSLQWLDVIRWTVFPLLYITIVLIRGAFVSYYPYPFLNVSIIGFARVMLNCVVMGLGFILFSLVFVAVGKFTGQVK